MELWGHVECPNCDSYMNIEYRQNVKIWVCNNCRTVKLIKNEMS